jgi:UPF0176 protein
MTTEIIIYYKYTFVKDPDALVAWHKEFCTPRGLKGRIIIANEGINGTLEGTPEAIAAYEAELKATPLADFTDLWFKHSPGTGDAFPKLSVRHRKEIVSLGLPADKDIDPNKVTGKHISAEELKRWFEQGEQFEIIDMRNTYELEVGQFRGTTNPNTESFRDLPKVIDNLKHLKDKKVLTVCTYGVRCEKASGFLKANGFNDVYQLHGGIGTYMKKYPGQEFEGSLYVFDGRLIENFTDAYKKIGACTFCKSPCERFINCANDYCHRHMIVCENCSAERNGFCDNCRTKSIFSNVKTFLSGLFLSHK